ncbi:uncharacterized protein zbtb48 [Xenentodon cancila]
MSAVESSHAQRVLSSLNQQRAVGRFCDAVLSVGDGKIHLAHHNILACFSEVFKQSQANATLCTEFHLQGCPSDGLELLLNFVYTGKLKLDLENLDMVQQAATSLCVQEVLTLCQHFMQASVNPVPLKGKRGRSRKSASDGKAVRQEKGFTATADVSSFDTAPSFTTAATTTPTTTTRSGRVVKGPKRLVTADTSPDSDSARVVLTNVEKETVTEENLTLGRLAVETKIAEQHTGIHDSVDRQITEETAAEAEKEDDDDADDFEGMEDTDEDYIPSAEPTSSYLPLAMTHNQKAESKTRKNRNNDTMEGDVNKDLVQCPICHKFFKSKYYLKVHNRRHTGERPFACGKCGKRYFRKENLFIHETRDCARVQTYSCSTCSSTFNTKEDLRMHVVSHTGEMPHKCATCNDQFMYKKNLTVHMMKVHGHPKPHACPQCPKTFLTRTELRVHEAAKHRGEKPFVCEECGHRASSRNGLQMHIKAIHRNERPFVCNLCGHAFSQKNNLNMHLRVHSGEKPYQCHLCGKTFRTQASLDKHHRTHTGERPFSCDVCEQRFTEKGALLRHRASKHEEGRPHCCPICSKTFKAREQLRVHLRRHKGMRNFECNDCGYKFTRQAHLRRHIQIHKRTENYNPRQRKLRNVVVQVADGSPGESEATKSAQEAASAENQQVADHTPEGAVIQEPTNPQPDPSSGLASSSMVRIVIESADAMMGEVVSNQNLTDADTEETFSVPQVPEVLQQTQLVSEAFRSTVDMDRIVKDLSENKT